MQGLSRNLASLSLSSRNADAGSTSRSKGGVLPPCFGRQPSGAEAAAAVVLLVRLRGWSGLRPMSAWARLGRWLPVLFVGGLITWCYLVFLLDHTLSPRTYLFKLFRLLLCSCGSADRGTLHAGADRGTLHPNRRQSYE